MTKINTPKSFDKGQIPAELLGQIEPYIDYTNQNFSQIIQALSNGISFPDNIRCTIKTVSVKHLVDTRLNLGVKNVVGFLVLNATAPIRSYTVTQVEGLFSFVFRFDEVIPIASKSIVASSGTMTVETNNVVLPGDMIRLAGYSSGGVNNGDFMVSYVFSSTPKKVEYRNGDTTALSETLTAYTTAGPAARSVTLAFLTS